MLFLTRYTEINYYAFNNPGTSTGGDAIGHFTQMVWRGSQKLGVGIAASEADADGMIKTYIVARYSPGGNVAGAYGSNVGGLKSRGRVIICLMLSSKQITEPLCSENRNICNLLLDTRMYDPLS